MGPRGGGGAYSDLIFPEPNFGSNFFWVGGCLEAHGPPTPLINAACRQPPPVDLCEHAHNPKTTVFSTAARPRGPSISNSAPSCRRYRWEPLPPGRYSADDLLIMPQLQPLTPLGASSSLHGLALHLRAGDFGDSDVPPILGPLSAVRPLRSLTLDLFDNQLETPGAQALVAILTAIPGLCALHLNMGYNALDCTGAKALAGLKNAPALETLSLQLLGANLGLDAAQVRFWC